MLKSALYTKCGISAQIITCVLMYPGQEVKGKKD